MSLPLGFFPEVPETACPEACPEVWLAQRKLDATYGGPAAYGRGPWGRSVAMVAGW